MYLYAITTERDSAVKFGITEDIDRRMQNMQTANPEELALLSVVKFPNKATAAAYERRIHSLLSPDRIRGEWFSNTALVNEVVDSLQEFQVFPNNWQRFELELSSLEKRNVLRHCFVVDVC